METLTDKEREIFNLLKKKQNDQNFEMENFDRLVDETISANNSKAAELKAQIERIEKLMNFVI